MATHIKRRGNRIALGEDLEVKRLLILLFIFSSGARGESLCANTMRGNSTAALISYLNTLVEERIISEEALWELALKLHNPLAQTRSTAVRIHARALDEYLSAGDLDAQIITDWALDHLAAQEKIASVRAGTRELTLTGDSRIKLHRVEPGSAHDFTLDHPIEVMETLVTQRMYADVMHANPSDFARDLSMTMVTYEDRGVVILPNHPVENLTWFEAIKYANQLSALARLKPAYLIGKNVTVNAPDGDIYRAEGYRLPTLAEFQYLASRDRTPFKRYTANVNDYFWHASLKPHAVATKLPMIIDGQEFFDLLGNVRVWIHDVPGVRAGIVLEGLNPVLRSTLRSNLGLTAGMGFYGVVQEAVTKGWSSTQLTDRAPDVGLRLVRTVK